MKNNSSKKKYSRLKVLDAYNSQHGFVNKIIHQSYDKTTDDYKVLKNVNVTVSFAYLNYVLLILVIGSLASFFVSFFLEISPTHARATNVWSIITLAIVIVSFSFNYRIPSQKKINIKRLHKYMLGMSFVIGLIIAAGATVLLLFQGLPVGTPHHTHVGYTIFVLVLYLVLLGAFGNKPEYIAIILITSLLPAIYFISQDITVFFHEPYFYLYGTVFLFAYGIAVFEEFRVRSQACWQYIQHWKTLKDFEKQSIIMQANQKSLQNEADARSEAEKKLQVINSELEQTIEARTQDITTINENLIKSKQSLEMAHEAAGLASWEWDICNKTFTGLNFDTLLEFNKEEITALLNNFYTLVHPEDESALKDTVRKFLKQKASRLHAVFRMKTKSGDWIWIDLSGLTVKRYDKSQLPCYVVGIVRDITLDKNVTESLNLSNKVFEQSSESIFVLDSNMKYISVNPSYEKVMGYTMDELEGKPLFLWDNTDLSIINQKILHKIHTLGEFNGEIQERNKNGERLSLQLSINQVIDYDTNEVSNYVGIFSDLTQQTKDRQKLSYLENYDQLTDLPNRNLFKQQLHTVISETNERFCVVRINIDRFRLFNESYGSKNADLLLKQVSERIGELNYSFWSFARLGGDDFAILFKHKNLYKIKKFLDSILEEFQNPFYVSGREVKVSLSIGVSLYPQHGHQVDALLTKSEQALNVAKKNGGNEYFIYNQGLDISPQDTLSVENELRHAIVKGELVVFYQPKICLKENKLIGFEGLVRWDHPTKGLLMPNEFMNVAAQTGLLHEVGSEILTVACTQIAKWSRANLIDDCKIALNIEVQQLKRGNFLESLDNLLDKHKVNPNNLELEITESSLMDMPDKMSPLLQAIKERDIKLAMDDFGTGYSSLAYLSEYPIDIIKIDRSFIKDLESNENSQAIVKAIIAMGKSLGMTLVAEGVENSAHVTFLNKEGCDIAQGYYFGKPVPALQATKILEREANK